MFLPPAKAKQGTHSQYSTFLGYSEREKPDDTQFSYMRNMSDDALPAAVPRKGRKKIAACTGITNLCAPAYQDSDLTDFTGVAGRYFYYHGQKISNRQLSAGRKEIADFNGKICIFPDRVFYNYLPDPETGEVNETLQDMGRTMTLSGVQFYASQDELTGDYTAYLQKTGANFQENFQSGDSLVIAGCASRPDNNTFVADSRMKFASDTQIVSVVVEKAESSRLTVLLYNKQGKLALFQNGTEAGSVTLSVYIPEMDHICVHNNRLWGTAANGEFLYASKLGDCQNFQSFQGLADDSWYCAIGTEGAFTGIVSYRSAVVAFKRSYIHHVYGDAPHNFSVPKQTACGAWDGRSIVELEGVLYFLSSTGFCAYSGGEPYRISSEISTPYQACAAGTDGTKYYACAKRADGTCDVLAYHPQYAVWHKEDQTEFVDFLNYRDRLYAATASEVYMLGEGDEVVSWCCVSKQFTLGTMQHKGAHSIYLRLDLKQDAVVRVFLSRDGGDFLYCGTIAGQGFLAHRLPVRFGKCDSFRIMLEGEGRAVIHDMEIVQHVGGRRYEL